MNLIDNSYSNLVCNDIIKTFYSGCWFELEGDDKKPKPKPKPPHTPPKQPKPRLIPKTK